MLFEEFKSSASEIVRTQKKNEKSLEQEFYLLVVFHFYVVAGDETFSGVELRSVPVHVIFHIENLQCKIIVIINI